MMYEIEKQNLPEPSKEPSLSEMTKVAVQRLEQEENGYYLFVEGKMLNQTKVI